MYRTQNGHVVRAMTIAGSDSGGGAGLQADMKTMHQFGVYGMTVITAVTAQNTAGVSGVHAIPPKFVGEQLIAVLDDFGVDAVKIGMLGTSEIIEVVADFLQASAISHVVLDPVMVAKGGASLMAPDAVDTLKRRLLPRVQVATPNLPEASALVGYPIENAKSVRRAARDIAEMGVPYVVIKGGHPLPENPASAPETESASTDLLYTAGVDTYTEFAAPRIDSRKTHGTGCTYSSAAASLLARGWDVPAAIAGAKSFVTEAIIRARNWDVGSGHGPIDHSSPVPQKYDPVAGAVNRYQDGAWTVNDERRQ